MLMARRYLYTKIVIMNASLDEAVFTTFWAIATFISFIIITFIFAIAIVTMVSIVSGHQQPNLCWPSL